MEAEPDAVPRRLDRASLLRATRELCRRDADLARVVGAYGPPPLWARAPGFSSLVQIILGQHVSTTSARAVFRRLQAAVGKVTGKRLASLSSAELRDLGLTRQKAESCLALARRVEAGEVDLGRIARLDDTRARSLLVENRGVGEWTAAIYLLMALRRPDVWPRGDLALAQAARRVKRLRSVPTTDRLDRLATSWRPWRSVGARILWHHYLCERRG